MEERHLQCQLREGDCTGVCRTVTRDRVVLAAILVVVTGACVVTLLLLLLPPPPPAGTRPASVQPSSTAACCTRATGFVARAGCKTTGTESAASGAR